MRSRIQIFSMFNLFLCSQAYAFSLVGLLSSSLLTFNPSVFR